ncbi:kinase-like protein [Auricularia subglabra TFB-10046 SS5]|nr:kinase-like protein [Auricularia subglabra TFB-10046 SS5]
MSNPRSYLDSTSPSLYISGDVQHLNRPRFGSFGDVFPVKIVGWSDVQVAIKCMRYSEDDENRDAMNRSLEKEITALKLVEHPHVLRFYGLVRYFGDPCIVMPWIEHGSLRRYLKTHSEANRTKILAQVALALAHLHSGTAVPEGEIIIHGDIHAGNILIDNDGTALLGDFGLCKLVPPGAEASLSLRSGRPHGDIAYMAPELHGLDARRSRATDVFAFGILIFETYAGSSPTQLGPTKEAIVQALSDGTRPQRAEIARADLTDAIWGLACDCWKHTPGERPTMDHVVERIRGSV